MTSVFWIADGTDTGRQTVSRNVARACGAKIAAGDRFVYGGDVYEDGTYDPAMNTDWEYSGWDRCYGINSPGANALDGFGNGFNFLPYLIGHCLGNHEYHGPAVDATSLRPTETDDYWADTVAGTTRISRTLMDASQFGANFTGSDPNAAYVGQSSAVAQKLAVAQWSHLQVHDIGGWRFIAIDGGVNPTDAAVVGEGRAPSSGDYYDALADLIAPVEYRRLVVFVHFPRYTAGSSHTEAVGGVPMGPLWSLMAPKATLMMAGHNHHWERQAPRDASGLLVSDQRKGCTPITCGNGGDTLTGFSGTYDAANPGASVFRENTNFGFAEIVIVDENNLTVRYWNCGTAGSTSPTISDSVDLKAGVQTLRPVADIESGDFAVSGGSGSTPTTVGSDWASGALGTVTIPASAGSSADSTKHLWLQITSSLPQDAGGVPTPSPGTWTHLPNSPASVSGLDETTWYYTRAVQAGDGGATVTATGLNASATHKATVGVIHDTDGVDPSVGPDDSAQASLSSAERTTPAKTPSDINTLGIAVFTADSSVDPAGADSWLVGSSGTPNGAWSEIHEHTTSVGGGGGTRFIVVQVQKASITSPASTMAGATPTGPMGTQESSNVIALFSPLPGGTGEIYPAWADDFDGTYATGGPAV